LIPVKIMKKVLSLLIVLALCTVMFASCTDKDNNTNTEKKDGMTITDFKDDKETQETDVEKDISIEKLKKQISDSGAKLGVAYLGCFGETFDDTKEYLKDLGIYEDYPFVEEMELDDLVVNENNEMYLVVPAGNTETVKIYDGVLNEDTFELEKGELLGEAIDGKPFLLLCNISEIIPNVIISTGDLEYSPCLSGEDGELVEDQDIYDFSPYERIREYFDIRNGIADGADPVFCGSWFGESENGDYELMAMSLDLYVDGAATYVYGVGNSEPTEWFMGEWSFDAERDMILLDMYGGPPNDYEDSDELFIDPYELKCGFKWDMDYRDDGTYLILTHEEGDPILWGKNGATFEFVESSEPIEEDYTFLIGSWGVISETEETYLEIFDNGEAHYYVVCDGVTQKNFYGSWTAGDLTLGLSLYQFSEDGSAVEEPAVFFGDYGISYDGEFLTLSLIVEATDPLTAFMEENGYEQFMLCGVG